MQGQRGACNSSAETIDLNQGSVSSNSGPNQPTAWNSMLYPMDNNSVRTFGGWRSGESSSSTSPNLQFHGLGGNMKSDSSLDAPPSIGPSNILLGDNSLGRPLSGSTRTPLNINLNAEHMATGSDGSPETADAFPYNYDTQNDDGASTSSLDDWSSSFKRKALDGGSSNCFQQGEAFDRRDFHDGHGGSSSLSTSSPPLHPSNFGHSEELSLRIGIGRGAASDVFPPISVTETGESSSRNYGVRVNHEYGWFSLPSTRNTLRQPDIFNRHQSSRPISPPHTFEFRPVSSSARNQPQLMHTPELSRNAPPFSIHGAGNSRAGGSSGSSLSSAERGILLRDEANSATLTRNRVDHSSFSHFSEIRNNVNISPENARNSVSPFPPPWAAPQHHGSSRNPQRSSQFFPWAPFPSVDSESGNRRGGHFPPLRSGSSSSEETVVSSEANQGHHHHTLFQRPSLMMELEGDWHALAADIEGRQRLVSEIRHVLNAMRRGDNLRDEDYMLIDPFINGIAELHDRHRDMRLDVDNMSYEELLALEERIGDVNTGLSEEAILKSMKQRKHLCLFDRSSSNLEPCSICREEYALGDDVGELDCGHDFHTDCIKQWLMLKNLCPICKMTALGT